MIVSAHYGIIVSTGSSSHPKLELQEKSILCTPRKRQLHATTARRKLNKRPQPTSIAAASEVLEAAALLRDAAKWSSTVYGSHDNGDWACTAFCEDENKEGQRLCQT